MAPAPEQTSRFSSPLFFWEALRGARKVNQYLPRLILPAVLLTMLIISFAGKDITQTTASYFAENVFNLYITIQYLAVGFLTPLHVAGTIVDERQRGTLLLLLTTHLTPREIVFGKMLGSIVPVLAVMLAGMPVLALLQLFGGVDFVKVVWHTVLALLLMLAFAMYAIRSSTQHSTVGSALFYTYMKIVGGLFMFYILSALTVLIFWASLQSTYISTFRNYPLEWFLTLLVLYNLLVAYLFSYRGAIAAFQVQHRSKLLFTSERPVENISRARALGYVNELKQQKAERQVETVVEGIPAEIETPLQAESIKPADRPWLVPAINKMRPVVWRLMYFPDRTGLIAAVNIVLVAVLLFLFVTMINRFQPNQPSYRSHREPDFLLIRIPLFLFMAMVLLRSCSVLAEERMQKTLLTLLTLPMTYTQLVIDIAWGCVWRYRWLGLVCLLPLLEATMLDSFAMILVLGTVLSQLVLLVMLSLFLSLVLQTAMRTRMVVITVLMSLVINTYALFWNYDWSQAVLLVPFQRLPYPFIHVGADGIQLLGILFVYWLVHWVIAYLLLVLIIKQLKGYAARS
jgi:ABC-type transport system involved in multi-copper enzyme maturation permease subunit